MSKLDEWLGRASLKERIEELSDENDRLRSRLEAESDRRAEAVRDRQDAEERVNRLEDRIAQLEGELDRVATEDDADLEFRRQDRLRGREVAAVLGLLESIRTAPEGALMATVQGGSGRSATGSDDGASTGNGGPTGNGGSTGERPGHPAAVSDLLGERAALVERASPCLYLADDAGIVSVALSPPVVPTVDPTWDDRFRLEREWFLPGAAGRYALALVRADLFALGIYDGDERVAVRGFESDVKSSHSKGGFSQARFERIRDDQIDDHLERCGEAIADALSGEWSPDGVDAADVDGVDRLFLVGQSGAVDAVAAETSIEPAATATVDATGSPEDALDDAFRSFWTTTLRVV